MRITGRGHPAIRAAHDKTLEFSVDASITERATCVLSVATDPPAAPLAGPVRITVRVREEAFALEAEAVSTWQPGGSLVVRRGTARTPTTFAVEATADSTDLPRPMVEALRDPDAEVVIDIEPITGPSTLVLAPASLAGAALAAEREAADHVLLEPLADPVHRPGPDDAARVLVLSAAAFPGRGLDRSRRRVRTTGLAPEIAAAAAAPWNGPVVFGVAYPGPESLDLLRRAPREQVLVMRTRSAVDDLLADAARIRGSRRAVVARADADVELVTIGDPVRAAGTAAVWCCLEPAADDLDPAFAAAIDTLLAEGVPTRTAAKALAALTGWERRRAYDVVLGRRPAT